jgi:hypothetical protein
MYRYAKTKGGKMYFGQFNTYGIGIKGIVMRVESIDKTEQTIKEYKKRMKEGALEEIYFRLGRIKFVL